MGNIGAGCCSSTRENENYDYSKFKMDQMQMLQPADDCEIQNSGRLNEKDIEGAMVSNNPQRKFLEASSNNKTSSDNSFDNLLSHTIAGYGDDQLKEQSAQNQISQKLNDSLIKFEYQVMPLKKIKYNGIGLKEFDFNIQEKEQALFKQKGKDGNMVVSLPQIISSFQTLKGLDREFVDDLRNLDSVLFGLVTDPLFQIVQDPQELSPEQMILNNNQDELEKQFCNFTDEVLEKIGIKIMDMSLSQKCKLNKNSIEIQQLKFSEDSDLILSLDPEKQSIALTVQNLALDFKTDEFDVQVQKNTLSGVKGKAKLQFEKVSMIINLQYTLFDNHDPLNYSLDEYNIKQDLKFDDASITFKIPKQSMSLDLSGVEQQAVIQSITDIIKRQFVDKIIQDLTTQITLSAQKQIPQILNQNSSEKLRCSIVNLILEKKVSVYKIDRNLSSIKKQTQLNVLNLQILGLLYCGSSQKQRLRKLVEIIKKYNQSLINQGGDCVQKENTTFRQVVGLIGHISFGFTIDQHNQHVKRINNGERINCLIDHQWNEIDLEKILQTKIDNFHDKAKEFCFSQFTDQIMDEIFQDVDGGSIETMSYDELIQNQIVIDLLRPETVRHLLFNDFSSFIADQKGMNQSYDHLPGPQWTSGPMQSHQHIQRNVQDYVYRMMFGSQEPKSVGM